MKKSNGTYFAEIVSRLEQVKKDENIVIPKKFKMELREQIVQKAAVSVIAPGESAFDVTGFMNKWKYLLAAIPVTAMAAIVLSNVINNKVQIPLPEQIAIDNGQVNSVSVQGVIDQNSEDSLKTFSPTSAMPPKKVLDAYLLSLKANNDNAESSGNIINFEPDPLSVAVPNIASFNIDLGASITPAIMENLPEESSVSQPQNEVTKQSEPSEKSVSKTTSSGDSLSVSDEVYKNTVMNEVQSMKLQKIVDDLIAGAKQVGSEMEVQSPVISYSIEQNAEPSNSTQNTAVSEKTISTNNSSSSALLTDSSVSLSGSQVGSAYVPATTENNFTSLMKSVGSSTVLLDQPKVEYEGTDKAEISKLVIEAFSDVQCGSKCVLKVEVIEKGVLIKVSMFVDGVKKRVRFLAIDSEKSEVLTEFVY